MKIRAGLQRKRRKPRTCYGNHEYHVSVDLPEYTDDQWGDRALYRKIVEKVEQAHPGWKVHWFALVREES